MSIDRSLIDVIKAYRDVDSSKIRNLIYLLLISKLPTIDQLIRCTTRLVIVIAIVVVMVKNDQQIFKDLINAMFGYVNGVNKDQFSVLKLLFNMVFLICFTQMVKYLCQGNKSDDRIIHDAAQDNLIRNEMIEIKEQRE